MFEDDDLVVVDKPSGMLTSVTSRSGPRTAKNVFDLVKEHVRRHSRRHRAWIVHRLDKEASGLLVFAKNPESFESLKTQFRSKKAHRIYFAVSEGEYQPKEPTPGLTGMPAGTIQSFLRQNARGLMESVPAGEAAKLSAAARAESGDEEADEQTPRLAVTHYRVVARGKGRTLFQLRLETGRKNQIRVHLRDLGYPISGDFRYRAMGPGGEAPPPLDRDQIDMDSRVCLHAAELGLDHPRTGATARFRSPPPGMFYKMVGEKSPAGSGEDDDRGAGGEPAGQHETRDVSPAGPAVKSRAAAGAEREAAKPDAGGATGRGAGVDRAGTGAGVFGAKASSDPAADAGRDEDSWEHVAGWYTGLVEERKSDHHEQVVLPGTLALLDRWLRPGASVLDIACGTGILSRRLAERGCRVLGLDSSPALIEAGRSAGIPGGGGYIDYRVHDARELSGLDAGPAFARESEAAGFDAAACVLALMNIDPMSPVLRGCAAALRAGSPLVFVVLHPAFRSPGRSGWGFETVVPAPPKARGPKLGRFGVPVEPRPGPRPAAGTGPGGRGGQNRGPDRGLVRGGPSRFGGEQDRPTPPGVFRQFRRVESYLTPGRTSIVMNPGAVSSGAAPVTTVTYHRPIGTYVAALAAAGFVVDAIEEWSSRRVSQPGPKAAEENRARAEFPMFMAVRAIRTGA